MGELKDIVGPHEAKFTLSLLLINLQSIRNKLHEFETILAQSKTDIICVNEHWLLAEEIPLYVPEGFVLASYYCRQSAFGGSSIYVKSDTTYEVLDMREYGCDAFCEASAIRLHKLNISNVSTFSVLYADDTTLVQSDIDLVGVQNKLDIALMESKSWFSANMLAVNEVKSVLDTWKQYFSKLLNADGGVSKEEENEDVYQNVQPEVCEPSESEVHEAIKQLSSNRAPGNDGIPVEIFKVGGKTLLINFHKLILEIWRKESMPDEWNEAVITPIHKKGDKTECNNYRVNSGKYSVYYSGRDDGIHQAGVGFAIKKNIQEALVKCEAVNERLCLIRLRCRFKNMTVINMYAPTEDKQDETKDEFYGQIEEIISDIPSYDIKILLGDANAKVGKEELWGDYAGMESLHNVSNDNGIRLLSLACATNLYISSTSFQHKNIHKETWISPDGRTKNQIDHVLIDKRHKTHITDVRSLRGAEREKKKCLLSSNSNETTREQLRELNKQIVKKFRAKKRQYVSDQLKKAEEDRTHNNAKEFFRAVRFFRKGFSPKTNSIKDENGNLTCEVKSVLDTWKQYFSKLLNADGGVSKEEENEDVYQNVQPEVCEPSESEVHEAIKQLSSNRAPGNDGIPVEIFKVGGKTLLINFHKLILEIWRKESMPDEWNEAVITPIHKKGDKTECNNYRGISLLSSAYKVLSKVILNRLKVYIEENIEDHQAGFIQGRSTTDQIFTIKQSLSKYWEYNKEVHLLFIDFQKAYDSVLRKKMYEKMKMFGIPDKLINLTRMCIQKSRCKVKINGEYTSSFEVTTGVRQGDGLSPLLFNLVIEDALKKTKQLAAGINIGIKINVLAFADDVALLAENRKDLESLTKVLIKEANHVGLTINHQKTKYMNVARTEGVARKENFKVDDLEFEHVDEFKYLGITITHDNKEEKEIQNRVIVASATYWSLVNMLKSKTLSKNTKIKIYHSIILPVLLYGSETWALTKEWEKKLIIFENKILRKIYGPIQDEEGWRIRKNRELRDVYHHPDVVARIKSRRLRWAGHVWRRENSSLIKTVDQNKPEGRRPLGRPRLRWRSQVLKDVAVLGTTPEAAVDREEWRSIVGEAKNLLRFQWPRR
ncbi:uncharacterized protein LOC129004977 [Macrosteles quadrilineatus]|uniref:uncharacterized protein LOC129004977 n=1 Tax=Macrosteles quadrilineatus TaxID=74068 RepID=UPI0023E3206C|nr:uncharacterized protein LOC129004977 [Macrosteles quadrilineatus]